MQKAWNAIRTWHMIQPQDRVLVGVSGGADSVCLLMVLLEFQKQMTFEIKVVHVEHGIRGEESLRDERYVRELCEKYQVEYECVSCDIPAMAKDKKLSTEEAGRNARYEAFDRIGEKWKADRIAVAHNQNDQAETILWNLARGSGLDGAAGIRPVWTKLFFFQKICNRPWIINISLCSKSKTIIPLFYSSLLFSHSEPVQCCKYFLLGKSKEFHISL